MATEPRVMPPIYNHTCTGPDGLLLNSGPLGER